MDKSEVVEWRREDSEQAIREGWDIFDSQGSENGPWLLCSLDEPELWPTAPNPYPFKSDTEVWEYVTDKAEAGSELHVRALAFLRAYNPTEIEAISKWLD